MDKWKDHTQFGTYRFCTNSTHRNLEPRELSIWSVFASYHQKRCTLLPLWTYQNRKSSLYCYRLVEKKYIYIVYKDTKRTCIELGSYFSFYRSNSRYNNCSYRLNSFELRDHGECNSYSLNTSCQLLHRGTLRPIGEQLRSWSYSLKMITTTLLRAGKKKINYNTLYSSSTLGPFDFWSLQHDWSVIITCLRLVPWLS